METLDTLMRVAHVGSAIALLGAALFRLVAVAPALRLLDDGLKDSVLTLMRRRFARIAHPAIALLLVTGAWQWVNQIEVYRVSRTAHMLLGIKALLGVVLMVLVFMLATGLARDPRGNLGRLGVLMGLVVITLAAVVRQLRLETLAGGGG